MYPCDLDLWPIFTKIGSHDWEVMLNIPAHFQVYRLFLFLKYTVINCRFRGPIARHPSLPWPPVCAPLVGGRPHVTPNHEVDRPTQYWVIAIFNWIRYATLGPWPYWPLHLGVMSRDAILVVNACANFKMYMTYCSRVMTITIFHCPPA